MINDKFSHEAGDLFLKDFSTILMATVRRGDIPARHAGDNFTAILPIYDEEQAYIVAKRLMENLRSHSLSLLDNSLVSGILFLKLSPKAIGINNFMPTVRTLFRNYGIKPSDMVFEIT